MNTANSSTNSVNNLQHSNSNAFMQNPSVSRAVHADDVSRVVHVADECFIQHDDEWAKWVERNLIPFDAHLADQIDRFLQASYP